MFIYILLQRVIELRVGVGVVGGFEGIEVDLVEVEVGLSEDKNVSENPLS